MSYWSSEAEVNSKKCKWRRDSKPESNQGNKSAEWHSSTAAVDPQEQIQHKEHTKHDPEQTQQHSQSHTHCCR